MSLCNICGREMTDGVSCRPDPIYVGGEAYEPIRYGQEWSAFTHPEECSDCRTPLGGVHHPGCCVEQCPVCFGQALGCLCLDPLCTYESPRAPRCRSHVFRRACGG